MTFDDFIDKNHLKVDVVERRKKFFTLDDMRECWNASANNIAQRVIEIRQGKFENLPHRSEDEQI